MTATAFAPAAPVVSTGTSFFSAIKSGACALFGKIVSGASWVLDKVTATLHLHRPIAWLKSTASAVAAKVGSWMPAGIKAGWTAVRANAHLLGVGLATELVATSHGRALLGILTAPLRMVASGIGNLWSFTMAKLSVHGAALDSEKRSWHHKLAMAVARGMDEVQSFLIRCVVKIVMYVAPHLSLNSRLMAATRIVGRLSTAMLLSNVSTFMLAASGPVLATIIYLLLAAGSFSLGWNIGKDIVSMMSAPSMVEEHRAVRNEQREAKAARVAARLAEKRGPQDAPVEEAPVVPEPEGPQDTPPAPAPVSPTTAALQAELDEALAKATELGRKVRISKASDAEVDKAIEAAEKDLAASTETHRLLVEAKAARQPAPVAVLEPETSAEEDETKAELEAVKAEFEKVKAEFAAMVASMQEPDTQAVAAVEELLPGVDLSEEPIKRNGLEIFSTPKLGNSGISTTEAAEQLLFVCYESDALDFLQTRIDLNAAAKVRFAELKKAREVQDLYEVDDAAAAVVYQIAEQALLFTEMYEVPATVVATAEPTTANGAKVVSTGRATTGSRGGNTRQGGRATNARKGR